jgi:cellulose synthase/poly-beta-1,6-N-acetylglucosamine synthase-like glycosyltransferase
MKNMAKKPWNLEIIKSYKPSVTILVPAYNEEKIIRLKLQNLVKLNYPIDKIDIIVVNDASTDKTLSEINSFRTQNPFFKIKVFDCEEHLGKAECLNRALELANTEVVIISDADCFLPSEILQKALSYLADPNVGAITAREVILNPHFSWVTQGEQIYNNMVQSIRIGESKVHSTIFFQGGFAAYKREFLQGFNCEVDDSGTAVDVIQKKGRTLLVPELIFYTMFPSTWINKLSLKIRRASQLQRIWAKCLGLLLRGKLLLPKRIVIPEIFLHLFNPIFFIVLIMLSFLIFTQYPLLAVLSFLVIWPSFLFKITRYAILEVLQNNLILLISLIFSLSNKQFISWNTVNESRSLITEQLLKAKGLI